MDDLPIESESERLKYSASVRRLSTAHYGHVPISAPRDTVRFRVCQVVAIQARHSRTAGTALAAGGGLRLGRC